MLLLQPVKGTSPLLKNLEKFPLFQRENSLLKQSISNIVCFFRFCLIEG